MARYSSDCCMIPERYLELCPASIQYESGHGNRLYVIRHTSLCPSFAPYDHESGHDDHLFQQKDGRCSYANSSVQQVIELLLCSLYNDQWMCQVAIFATEGQTMSIHYNSLSSVKT